MKQQPPRPGRVARSPGDAACAPDLQRRAALGSLLALTGITVAAGADTPSLPSARDDTPSGSTAPADPALAAAARYPDETRWGIFRKGDRIGTHTVRFVPDGADLQVEIASRIRVTVLRIPVFRFEYDAIESWQAGALASVDVRLSENGDRRELSMRSSAQRSELINTDGRTSVPRLTYASNHWHAGVLGSRRMYNTLTGAVSKVVISSVGRDAFAPTATSASLPYTRYRYAGDVALEAWYDDADRWVGLAFAGEDGSRIEYRLEPGFR